MNENKLMSIVYWLWMNSKLLSQSRNIQWYKINRYKEQKKLWLYPTNHNEICRHYTKSSIFPQNSRIMY